MDRGKVAAGVIANSEPFNYGAADVSMRNVVALFTMPGGITGDTLTQMKRLQPANSGEADSGQKLIDLAQASLGFLGADAREAAREQVAQLRPESEADAVAAALASVFGNVQIGAGMGPGAGYDAEREADLRGLVVDYANTFADVYTNLAVLGHELTQPAQRGYFEGNIRAIEPPAPQPSATTPGTDEYVDYI